ncbi:MAG: rRNA maturation RNase YbeY [Deferribacteraceae bacterium]|jgi:probable rRNA maturation factor|nr:rRNA maturation RNase YbeY [Deferribacteraceae bacterium]
MKIFFDSTLATKYDEEFFLSIIDKIAESAAFEPEAELSLTLTDDEIIRSINKQYRKKNKATDVLSFPMYDKFMLGDIVISLESAEKQATGADITTDREVAFLFIHGFLHLLGFDHERSSDDEEKMYDLQEEILRQWEAQR